jgi:hypothetical protein
MKADYVNEGASHFQLGYHSLTLAGALWSGIPEPR